MHALLNEDWIKHYAEVWKGNTTAIEGTKGIDMIVQMSVSDRDRAPVHIHVNGDGSSITPDRRFPARTQSSILQLQRRPGGKSPRKRWACGEL